MSAFTEPFAQARENVDHAEALLTRDPFGEAERSLAATLLREALAALDLIEQRATELEAELAHLKSEYHFEGDRGDHLIYRDEWERFDRWQRAMEPLLAAYEKHLQTGLYEPLGMAPQDFLTALSAREEGADTR